MLKQRIFTAFCLLLLLTGCKRNDKSVTLVFGGDVMLDRGVRLQIKHYGLNYLLTDIQPEFKTADFGIVNLECPFTHDPSPLVKQFIFRAEPEWISDLSKNGITHCILANNHSYDQGRQGLIVTAANLEREKIKPVGYGVTQVTACEPVMLRKNDIEIALFSSVTLPLEAWTYLEESPGMCQATVDDLVTAITAFRKIHAETFIIVALHWGIEYHKMPTLEQRSQAESLINAGADMLVGHHPHVVQTYEKINNKPVFYSIGNLIFDNPKSETHDGILIKLTVKENRMSETEIIPYKTQNIKPIIQNSERRRF